MHKTAIGCSREDIVEQVKNKQESVHDYNSYVPIGNAINKLQYWRKYGAEIFYLTSRRKPEEIKQIRNVLTKFKFPEGQFLFRQKNEEYKDIVEKIIPDILIEDNCESIGGEKEMAITHVMSKIKKKIKSIIIKEFRGIDILPDNLKDLISY